MGFLVQRRSDVPGSGMTPQALPFGWHTPIGPAFTEGSALARARVAPVLRYNVGAAVTGITGVAATDILTKAAHGFVGGENVVGSALTGGTGLLPHLKGGLFVLFLSSSTFQLALDPDGPVLDLGTDVSALTLQKVASSAPIKQKPKKGQAPPNVSAHRHGR